VLCCPALIKALRLADHPYKEIATELVNNNLKLVTFGLFMLIEKKRWWPNVMMQWLALPPRTQKAPISITDQEAGYFG
jgi:hypothetical protein